jgi:hypothetical protein
MEGHFSTDQSPPWTVVPVEEEEEAKCFIYSWPSSGYHTILKKKM